MQRASGVGSLLMLRTHLGCGKHESDRHRHSHGRACASEFEVASAPPRRSICGHVCICFCVWMQPGSRRRSLSAHTRRAHSKSSATAAHQRPFVADKWTHVVRICQIQMLAVRSLSFVSNCSLCRCRCRCHCHSRLRCAFLMSGN